MDTIEAIHTRRSIRKYENRPVPADLIKELLAAAMSAPSAKNQQPWCFVVIDQREILDEFTTVSPHAEMCREAPLAIMVCYDNTYEKSPGFWVQDCSAAIQNLLLAAHASGLGAVWLGMYPREDRVEGCKKLCGLPEHVIPHAVIAVGYPAQEISPQDRYDEERIHHNRW